VTYINDLVESIGNPEEVCFWTGAGISKEAPTNLPLGIELTHSTIEHFCFPETWETILNRFSNAKMVDSEGNRKKYPRLEIILNSVVSVNGIESLKTLSSYGNAVPNHYHQFFAQHIIDNGYHITANFDTCIEKAYQQPLSLSKITTEPTNLFHYHGKYSDDQRSLLRLGITINNVAKGLPEESMDRIKKILKNVRFLVFLGYSGSDYFDVNPFFQDLTMDLKHLSVIWVKHSRNSSISSAITRGLQNCNAKVHVWVDEIHSDGSFLEHLANKWSFDFKKNIPSQKHKWSILCPHIHDSQKTISTMKMFSSMGIGDEVIRLEKTANSFLNSSNSQDFKLLINELLDHGYSHLGKYKKALGYSKKTLVANPKMALLRNYRIAGNYWLGFRITRAGWYFRKTLKQIDNLNLATCKDTSYLDFCVQALIDFLHYRRDLRKFTLYNRIASFGRETFAFQKLSDLSDRVIVNPHARAQITRVYQELTGIDKYFELPEVIILDSSALTSSFAETDSILGLINFSRWDIKKRLDTGKHVSDSEIELLFLRSKTIQDRPGMLKASVLLNTIGKGSLMSHIRTLIKTQWSITRRVLWLWEWTSGRLR
jgi:hypothetical protein